MNNLPDHLATGIIITRFARLASRSHVNTLWGITTRSFDASPTASVLMNSWQGVHVFIFTLYLCEVVNIMLRVANSLLSLINGVVFCVDFYLFYASLSGYPDKKMTIPSFNAACFVNKLVNY